MYFLFQYFGLIISERDKEIINNSFGIILKNTEKYSTTVI